MAVSGQPQVTTRLRVAKFKGRAGSIEGLDYRTARGLRKKATPRARSEPLDHRPPVRPHHQALRVWKELRRPGPRPAYVSLRLYRQVPAPADAAEPVRPGLRQPPRADHPIHTRRRTGRALLPRSCCMREATSICRAPNVAGTLRRGGPFSSIALRHIDADIHRRMAQPQRA